jgi:hypothetical protein
MISFTAPIWLWQGKGAWHFITLPQDKADDIKRLTKHKRGGWGSVKVSVTIGESTWLTSIFPQNKTDTFILPMKGDIRKKESLSIGDRPLVTLELVNVVEKEENDLPKELDFLI